MRISSFVLSVILGTAALLYQVEGLSFSSVDAPQDKVRLDAEKGDPNAQFEMGRRYYYGDGVKVDYEKAVKWYRKAAEQGNASAQNNLGLCYENGNGVRQDYVEAAKWYRRSADQGYVLAQSNLGLCYEYGKGVTQNYSEAVGWYRKSADQGNAVAQNNLGLCYENGNGVRQDYVEAAKWYRRSADQGYVLAQSNLGLCYEYGKGVTQNHEEAAKWYSQAANKGNETAKKKLQDIHSKLSQATNNQPRKTQETKPSISLDDYAVSHEGMYGKKRIGTFYYLSDQYVVKLIFQEEKGIYTLNDPIIGMLDPYSVKNSVTYELAEITDTDFIFYPYHYEIAIPSYAEMQSMMAKTGRVDVGKKKTRQKGIITVSKDWSQVNVNGTILKNEMTKEFYDLVVKYNEDLRIKGIAAGIIKLDMNDQSELEKQLKAEIEESQRKIDGINNKSISTYEKRDEMNRGHTVIRYKSTNVPSTPTVWCPVCNRYDKPHDHVLNDGRH